MALIHCPECGKEISDKAEKCIHCGHVMKEQPKIICEDCGNEIPEDATVCPTCGCPLTSIEESTEEQPVNYQPVSVSNANVIVKKRLNEQAITIIVASILSIIAVVSFFFLKNKVILNDDEQLAFDNIMSMKAMMKDPDSFKLYDEIEVYRIYNDDGSLNRRYTIFKYGGTNSYGGIVSNEAIFEDQTFLINYDDELTDADKKDIDMGIRKAYAKLYFAHMALYGLDDNTEEADINIDKIKSKVGLV